MVVILLSSKEDDYSAVRACITRHSNSIVSAPSGISRNTLAIRKICGTVSDAVARQLGRVVDLKLVILLVLIALSE